MPTDKQREAGRRYGRGHAAKRAEYNKQYRKAHPDKVKGWNKAKNIKYFETNQARQKKYVEERIAKGICRFCGRLASVPGLQYCADCRAKAAKRCANRREAGVCSGCGKNPGVQLPDQSKLSRCETCYFKHAAHTNLGDRKLWAVLRDVLAAQNYLCPYTGDRLVIGLNASVDHKLPWSRFAELRHDPQNIEWVSECVNAFKLDRTPDEFLDLVRRIYSYRLQGGEVHSGVDK